MVNRIKPVIDYESYVARINLEKSKELPWRNDVSYFWASIMKMKRRALKRKAPLIRGQVDGKKASP